MWLLTVSSPWYSAGFEHLVCVTCTACPWNKPCWKWVSGHRKGLGLVGPSPQQRWDQIRATRLIPRGNEVLAAWAINEDALGILRSFCSVEHYFQVLKDSLGSLFPLKQVIETLFFG